MTGRFITGSPFGTNYFELCGPLPAPTLDVNGVAIPGTGNANYACFRQDLFALTGMLRNLEANPIGSPLSIQRATYNRDAAGARVDVMARASSSPGQGAPKLSTGGQSLPPVLMDGPTVLGDWYAQGIPFPVNAVPSTIAVTNSGDAPPTSVTTHVVDEVTVKSAVYDSTTSTITVVATSSDKGAPSASIAPASLSLSGFPTALPTPVPGSADPTEVSFTAGGILIPPAFVRVASSAGGQGQADLTMGVSTKTYPAGVPYVADDSIDAIQNGPTVIIPVLDNDVAPTGESLVVSSLTVLAPNANIGRADPTLSPNQGFIAYRPPSTTGTATFRYTVTGAAGVSNVGTVTVNVLAGSERPGPLGRERSFGGRHQRDLGRLGRRQRARQRQRQRRHPRPGVHPHLDGSDRRDGRAERQRDHHLHRRRRWHPHVPVHGREPPQHERHDPAVGSGHRDGRPSRLRRTSPSRRRHGVIAAGGRCAARATSRPATPSPSTAARRQAARPR